MKYDQIAIEQLIPYARNARTHSDEQVAQLAASIREFGFINPVIVDGEGGIIAGHGRVMAARKLEMTEVPCVEASHLTDAQKKAYILADNQLALNAGWDNDLLKIELLDLQEHEFDLDLIGFDDLELNELLKEEAGEDGEDSADANKKQSLAELFGIPPFSVLNAREGWWQDRKRAWLALGIKSELGRDAKAFGHAGATDEVSLKILEQQDGISIFDPVLCELAYRWFCPPGGIVLDPFAGGSVRGIVASRLGRQYVGVELRPEQVAANKAQESITIDPIPVWHCGDSQNIDKICHDVEADFVFSCPPYADLEVYSDDPNDLSTMDYPSFRDAYFEIIAKACERLKDNRFACFVVGDVRDKKGNYYNFVGDTVEAFKAAGLHYYNEAILVTAVGSLPIIVGRQFSSGRKLGKTHQNVLVFVKGDGKKATDAIGQVEFGDIDEK